MPNIVADTQRAANGNVIARNQAISSGSTVSGVTVSPSTATGSTTFSAVVSGPGSPSQAVNWAASAGSINSSGVFVAPAQTGSIQTITITATSAQDGSKSGTATVTIAAGTSTVTSVTISPSTATGSRTFTATVNGTFSPSQAVNWTSTFGSINSSGVFIAPAQTSSIQTGTVTATSVQDGSKSGTATVTIAAATAGGYNVSQYRANLLYQIALLHALEVGSPLTVSPSSRAAGGLAQSITGSNSDTVTISTTLAPPLSGNLDDWIDALADVYGLASPLVVTAGTRHGAFVSQTITKSGTVTTVTRQ